MPFFALVAADSHFAIELYPTREQAERDLRDAVADEPAFADLLSVEPVPELNADGRLN